MMTEENKTEKKYPTHTVYFLRNKAEGDTPEWIKTGAAWSHSDNEGLNISLQVLGHPVSLVIRKNKPKTE
ncbi:MAG: hypothetical protein ABIN24_01005 [Dyadobacter sp.]